MPLHRSKSYSSAQFLFPETRSSVLPDPSTFFSPNLLPCPLPTNSFFQNFVLNNGDQPEYIHPYLIKLSSFSLSLCYPSRFSSPQLIYQIFTPDLSISSFNSTDEGGGGGTATSTTDDDNVDIPSHKISSFDDLSVTLELPPSLRFFLVRGSPFVTCSTVGCRRPTGVSISTANSILFFSSNDTLTKHTLQLNNGRTYLCYSSCPLHLTQASPSLLLTTDDYSGVLRFAYLPDPSYEAVLDRHSSCYPVSGEAEFGKPFCLKYKWKKKGWGDLLLLAHPLHLRLHARNEGGLSAVLKNFKYNSVDGELVGVVGNSWILKADPIPLTWHSILGVKEESKGEIISTLYKDVEGLKPIAATSLYSFGKAVARAARLVLIAEEVNYPDVIPALQLFLKESITPWLDGVFYGNAFLYDPTWGGIITKQGSVDSSADSGFGVYNGHHHHLGYFLYAIAVLSKIDSEWGKKYKPQAYSMVGDIMHLTRSSRSNYTRLRCFDLWKLHSWAGGLTESADGRSQESTSEAVSAYYSAALMGLSYDDASLQATGSTLAALEIQSAQMWWHVREGERIYEEDFSRENRVVGVLWANKRESDLSFAPAEWRECRLGIQVLPLLPITQILFRDVGFVRELLKWVSPALERNGVEEGWKGFVYAMEGLYDRESALEKTRALSRFDDGNSLSNMLWWLHSRVVGVAAPATAAASEEEEEVGGSLGCCGRCCFGQYC